MSLNYLINLFAYKIYKDKLLSHSDLRKMRYGMTAIAYEVIKIIVLFIIFKIFNSLDLFLFSLCILMSIRIFAGGLHFDSSLICFIVSFIFFILTVILLPNIFLIGFYPGLIIGLIGVLILSLNSPRPSALRPIINKKRRQILKFLSAFSSLLWLIILLIFIQNPIFFACGIWTIFLQALQLLLGKEEKQ